MIGCKDPVEYNYDKATLLTDVAHGQILPSAAEFLIAADSLEGAAEAFVAAVDSVQLAALKAQWEVAVLKWKTCEVDDFGVAKDSYLSGRIGKWPCDPAIIEGKIAGTDSMDAAFFQNLGATARGLYAIEYLLFEHDPATTLTEFTSSQFALRRLTYLRGVATEVHSKAQEWHDLWSTAPENYAHEWANSSATGLEDPAGLLVNGIISVLEEVTKVKVGKPFGKFDLGILHPESVESPRTGISLALFRANLNSLEAIFRGTSETGLDQALDELHASYGEAALSSAIAQQFAAANHAMDQITMPFQDALINQHQQVEDLYQALKALTVLFKADVSSAMSITVTVSDTDGD
ncbi:MAG: imelysin family protein [Bacteroidia bacterium]